MENDSRSYDLFNRFIETYTPTGFRGIDRNDPLLTEFEKWMAKNNQFMIAGDYLKFEILFTSKLSSQIIGIEPEELNPYHFIEATHPDDMMRHNKGRAKNVDNARDLFIAKDGHTILSTNLRLRNAAGIYSDVLFQCFLFYSTKFNTIFLIELHTDIGWYKFRKNRFHYYVGNDLSMLRYPDEELLQIGIPLSDRELEIVKLIEAGLSSEQIAEKLFLSVHTVNTHRSNILDKTGFHTISELIFDFEKRGLL